jgi:hypothetical protein
MVDYLGLIPGRKEEREREREEGRDKEGKEGKKMDFSNLSRNV